MKILISFIQIGIICYVFKKVVCDEMCDAKQWYMEIMSEGLFEVDNQDVQEIKSTIEKLVSRRGPAMVPCGLLESYKEQLGSVQVSEGDDLGSENEPGDTENESDDSDNESNDTDNEADDTDNESNDTENESNDTEFESADSENESYDSENESNDIENESDGSENESSDLDKESDDLDKESDLNDTEQEEDILDDSENQTGDSDGEENNTNDIKYDGQAEGTGAFINAEGESIEYNSENEADGEKDIDSSENEAENVETDTNNLLENESSMANVAMEDQNGENVNIENEGISINEADVAEIDSDDSKSEGLNNESKTDAEKGDVENEADNILKNEDIGEESDKSVLNDSKTSGNKTDSKSKVDTESPLHSENEAHHTKNEDVSETEVNGKDLGKSASEKTKSKKRKDRNKDQNEDEAKENKDAKNNIGNEAKNTVAEDKNDIEDDDTESEEDKHEAKEEKLNVYTTDDIKGDNTFSGEKSNALEAKKTISETDQNENVQKGNINFYTFENLHNNTEKYQESGDAKDKDEEIQCNQLRASDLIDEVNDNINPPNIFITTVINHTGYTNPVCGKCDYLYIPPSDNNNVQSSGSSTEGYFSKEAYCYRQEFNSNMVCHYISLLDFTCLTYPLNESSSIDVKSKIQRTSGNTIDPAVIKDSKTDFVNANDHSQYVGENDKIMEKLDYKKDIGSSEKESDIEPAKPNKRLEPPRITTKNTESEEELLLTKKLQYTEKLQSIELNILKLENRVLSQAIEERDSAKTFRALEDQIAGLEKEILVLNSSIHVLNEQNKQLQKSKEKQEITVNDSKGLELMNSTDVARQHSRITEMAAMAGRQSASIEILEKRMHMLEEQNRYLYEALLNQSQLMNNVLTKYDELQREKDKRNLLAMITEVVASIKEDKSTEPILPDGWGNASAVEITNKKNTTNSTNIDVPTVHDGHVITSDEVTDSRESSSQKADENSTTDLSLESDVGAKHDNEEDLLEKDIVDSQSDRSIEKETDSENKAIDMDNEIADIDNLSFLAETDIENLGSFDTDKIATVADVDNLDSADAAEITDSSADLAVADSLKITDTGEFADSTSNTDIDDKHEIEYNADSSTITENKGLLDTEKNADSYSTTNDILDDTDSDKTTHPSDYTANNENLDTDGMSDKTTYSDADDETKPSDKSQPKEQHTQQSSTAKENVPPAKQKAKATSSKQATSKATTATGQKTEPKASAVKKTESKSSDSESTASAKASNTTKSQSNAKNNTTTTSSKSTVAKNSTSSKTTTASKKAKSSTTVKNVKTADGKTATDSKKPKDSKVASNAKATGSKTGASKNSDIKTVNSKKTTKTAKDNKKTSVSNVKDKKKSTDNKIAKDNKKSTISRTTDKKAASVSKKDATEAPNSKKPTDSKISIKKEAKDSNISHKKEATDSNDPVDAKKANEKKTTNSKQAAGSKKDTSSKMANDGKLKTVNSKTATDSKSTTKKPANTKVGNSTKATNTKTPTNSTTSKTNKSSKTTTKSTNTKSTSNKPSTNTTSTNTGKSKSTTKSNTSKENTSAKSSTGTKTAQSTENKDVGNKSTLGSKTSDTKVSSSKDHKEDTKSATKTTLKEKEAPKPKGKETKDTSSLPFGPDGKTPPKVPRYKSSDNTPKDCYDHLIAGRKRDMVLKIKPAGMDREVSVFCDMSNGGWTVIQRRQDGLTDFFRAWQEYKEGFGVQFNDHWIGNDVIHKITNQGHYSLRIDMQDWDRKKATVEYSFFLLEDESHGYRLHVDGFKGDDAIGDSLTQHHMFKFSTQDVDNDLAKIEFKGSCANRFYGSWWYHKCYNSNLNGKYYKGGNIESGQFDGVVWKSWKSNTYSLKKVEMKLRRVLS